MYESADFSRWENDTHCIFTASSSVTHRVYAEILYKRHSGGGGGRTTGISDPD